jgi:hypothetical protein
MNIEKVAKLFNEQSKESSIHRIVYCNVENFLHSGGKLPEDFIQWFERIDGQPVELQDLLGEVLEISSEGIKVLRID